MIYLPLPKRGDIVWCELCHAYRAVGKGPVHDLLTVRCQKCRFTRRAPTMRSATIRADTHGQRTKHPVDIVGSNDRLLKTIYPPE